MARSFKKQLRKRARKSPGSVETIEIALPLSKHHARKLLSQRLLDRLKIIAENLGFHLTIEYFKRAGKYIREWVFEVFHRFTREEVRARGYITGFEVSRLSYP